MLRVGWNKVWQGVGLVLILAVAGCAARKVSKADEAIAKLPEVVRIGVAADYRPLAFVEKGELQGAEVEFAKLVGEAFGRRIEFVKTKFEDLLPALEQGRVDIVMSGLSVTPERQKRAYFARPYLQVGQMVLIRSKDLTRFSDPDALQAKRAKVGVAKGTTGEAYAVANLKQAKLRRFPTPEAAMTALKKKDIDFFIYDAPKIWMAVGRPNERDTGFAGLYRPLTDEQLAWAVRSDAAEGLGAALDALVDQWRASGKIDEVLDHWIPVRRVAANE